MAEKQVVEPNIQRYYFRHFILVGVSYCNEILPDVGKQKYTRILQQNNTLFFYFDSQNTK